MVFAVNEGVVYMSANVPDHHHQADFVLSVDRDAQGTAVPLQGCQLLFGKPCGLPQPELHSR